MRYFFVLLQHDLVLYFVRRFVFLKFLFTFLCLLLVFSIVRNISVDLSLVGIVYVVTVIVQGQAVFQQDRDEHVLMQQTISGCPAHVIVLAKFCIVYGMQILLGLILTLFFYFFSLADYAQSYDILRMFIVLNVPVTAILLFSSVLTIVVRGNVYINALVAIPSILLSFLIINVAFDSAFRQYLTSVVMALSFLTVIYLCACSYLVSKIQS